MATVMNDRDVLLLNATQRTINPLTATILLTSDSPTFHVSSGGTTTPLQITVTAHLIGITGTASFTASGATIVDNGDNTATIDYAGVTASSVTVNASVVSNGQTFNAATTISKVMDGTDGVGTQGASGDQYAIAYLYKWSTVDVAPPTGSSTFDWASGVNTVYGGSDNWSATLPNNPGDPGARLYVAAVPITAEGGTTSSTVFYSNATVQYWSSNGQNGAQGAPGIKSFTVKAFQWANGPAPTATGTATFTWAGTSYDNVPSGSPNNWSKTKPAAPGPGFTLYEADVNIVENAGAATSPIDWTTANVVGTSYMGEDGTGSTGASSMIAYTLVDGMSLATSPASVTLDGHPLPTTGTWGETRAWTSQPSIPAAGQSIFQSNGTYDPNDNQVTWGVPYLSSLRVGDLSTITTNTGNLTFTGTAQSANGKIQLHADGSAVFQAITIENPDGSVILQAGGQLNPTNAAPGTLNSDLTPAINSAATTAQWTSVSNRPSDDSIKNNLIDLSWWQRLGLIAWPQNSELNVLGDSLNDYGLPGPKGTADTVWYCKETTGDGEGGGGWNSPYFSLDPTKTYRFVVPIRRISGSAQAYWGTNGVADLNTTTQTVNGGNPYFANTGGLPTDRWHLFVGYIYPANSTGHTSDGAGIWDCKTGQKVGAGTNYCFMPDGRQINHRAYQYYASPNAEQMFGRPMINVVDGTEPSLREYLEAGAVLNQSITISPNGALNGGGGGQVTLPGMGQNSFRVIAAGNSCTAINKTTTGFYFNGSVYAGAQRSYNLIAINRTNLAIEKNQYYDVYGSGEVGGRTSADLAADLNYYADRAGQYVLVVYTYDEPQQHRTDNGLPDAMYRNGASRSIFGSSQFAVRSAYGMVALSGCGEGNGAEFYQGSGDDDPNAWIDFSFNMLNGELASVSGGYKPTTLVDFGYTGALNANYTTNTNQLTDGAGLGQTALWTNIAVQPNAPASNATVGAPADTYVGDTLAQTVESNAAAGKSASDAINDPTNGLAQKLSASATWVLSGGAGLKTGSLAWDSNGNRTAGYGVGINQRGIVAYNSSGAITFTLDGSTGNAAFAGDISGASGSFAGNVSSSGYVFVTGTSGHSAYTGGTFYSSIIAVPSDTSRNGVFAQTSTGVAVHGEAVGAGYGGTFTSWTGIALNAYTVSGGSAIYASADAATQAVIQSVVNGSNGQDSIYAQANGGAGLYAVSSQGDAVVASGAGYAFYAQGGMIGPFTASHDGLLPKAETPEVGDIMVDTGIYMRKDVSNTIATMTTSSAPNQKSVIGVFVMRMQLNTERPPTALSSMTADQITTLSQTYDRIACNAVGEGQINVCGEGGDIQAGDYICTSSTGGKGMKQSDDLLHNYTVAKARESVSFSSPSEVKMIACTYHCG